MMRVDTRSSAQQRGPLAAQLERLCAVRQRAAGDDHRDDTRLLRSRDHLGPVAAEAVVGEVDADVYQRRAIHRRAAARRVQAARSAVVTGRRVARSAGSRPPIMPITIAMTKPRSTRGGVTLNWNTTCEKFAPSVETAMLLNSR